MSNPNNITLTTCLQLSNVDRHQGLLPHVNWSLKQPQKHHIGLLTTVIYPSPHSCNISPRVFEFPCPCKRNTHTFVLFWTVQWCPPWAPLKLTWATPLSKKTIIVPFMFSTPTHTHYQTWWTEDSIFYCWEYRQYRRCQGHGGDVSHHGRITKPQRDVWGWCPKHKTTTIRRSITQKKWNC